MMIRFRENGHPVFRATSPLSRGTLKSKGGGKLSIHFCADGDTIETVFRTNIYVNQFSIYGAVSDVCEECGTCQTRMVRPVLAGQSDPLFEPADLLMTTPTPSTEVPAQEWKCSARDYFERNSNKSCLLLFLSAVDLFNLHILGSTCLCFFGASLKTIVMDVGNGPAWAVVLFWRVLQRTSWPEQSPNALRRQRRPKRSNVVDT